MALSDEEEAVYHVEPQHQVTTDRELVGWYSFGAGAEIFAVCGVGSFLPVVLEQLAREAGVLRSDGTTPCVQPMGAAKLMRRDDTACVIHVLGAQINSSSFALYSLSLAVVVQTIVLVSISALADYGGNRKKLLLTFGFVGATASGLFIFVSPAIYLVGALLAVIAIASLGNSFVLLNAFLPLLASNHPSISGSRHDASMPLHSLTATEDNEDDDSIDGDTANDGLLSNDHQIPVQNQPQSSEETLKLSNEISSKGVGIGYAAAVFVQLISISIILLFNKFASSISKSTVPIRYVLLVVGIWWALFALPTVRYLQRRPGPPLPVKLDSSDRRFIWLHYVTFAWKSLWQTMKLAKQLRQVVVYLIGWFLLSDAVATISGTAILFARTELHLGTAAVAMLSITATASGIVGAVAWPKIGRRYNLSSIQIIITCICLFEFIPLYGLLGFLPFIQDLGVGGLQMWYEIYPLAFILGFVMGGIGSYCRSVFGLLIPRGTEAAFYALFAVTDKGSSAIGPVVVGRIVDATGSVRMGFWFLAVVMIAPAPVFWMVDVEKGRTDALAMADKMSKDGSGERRID